MDTLRWLSAEETYTLAAYPAFTEKRELPRSRGAQFFL